MERPPTPMHVRLLGRPVEAASLFFLVVYVVLAFIYYTAITAGSLDLPGKALLAALFVVQALLHHSVNRWGGRPRLTLYYLAVQAALVLASVLVAQQWFVATLLFGLVGEGIGLLPEPHARLALAGAVLLEWMLCTYLVGGLTTVWSTLPLGVAVIAFVALYVGYLVMQERERGRVEGLLRAVERANAELATAHRQLEVYATRVEALTVNQERQRLARELHDTLAQGLAGIIMQLEAVDNLLAKDNADKARQVAGQALERARGALSEARQSIQTLRAAPAPEGNFLAALQREVERFGAASGVPCALSVEGGESWDSLPAGVAQDGLRVVREGLANVARHAHASHASVTVGREGRELVLAVRDDGVGFDASVSAERLGHFGLLGLEERARLAGGSMSLTSSLGQGATLVVRLPLAESLLAVSE
ncbi:MAG: sensor histidine kinase [Chloroflexi bacterium]|nr:sensor histidine kinase [Chloroflexota bacterium]MCL5107520.1 sensor histidine kinase [Chloroflexota bacterium]